MTALHEVCLMHSTKHYLKNRKLACVQGTFHLLPEGGDGLKLGVVRKNWWEEGLQKRVGINKYTQESKVIP